MNDQSKQSWKARRFLSGDEESLSLLYEAINGHFDRNYWQWLFKENPSGEGHIWVAEEKKDKNIVGQYAVIPTALNIQGKKILGSQSLDTMTLPSYQKQGIFTGLARNLYDDSADRGIDLIYGFPNQNSSHGFLKHLDFFILFKPKLYSYPLKFASLLNMILNSKFISNPMGLVLDSIYKMVFPRLSAENDSGIRIQHVESFPEGIDKICRAYNLTFKNMVTRSTEYLNWRYYGRPDRSYKIYLAYKKSELAGYCVYGRTMKDGVELGLIMDIFADPKDELTLKTLICHVLNEMEKEGEALASCLLQPDSPFVKVLKKCGFIFPLTKFPPYILRLNSDKLKLRELNNLADWHITLGDADFV